MDWTKPEQSEREFLAENAAHLARTSQVISVCLPFGFASLFPVDLFLSNLIVTQHTLFLVRGCIVLYQALLAIVAFAPFAKRHADGFALLCFLSAASNILILTVLTGGSASPYNEAYIGAIFFMATFPPWRVRYFVAGVVTCALVYPLALLASGTLGAPDLWVSRIGCLLITCGLGIAASVFLASLRRVAFFSRLQLKSALATMSADLEQARTFQNKLLRPLPVDEGIEFAALYAPAEFLGGDFYEVTRMGPGWFRLFIADVTGHGTQAAMRTMILQQQLERTNRSSQTPWDLLATMNDAVLEAFGSMVVNYCALCVDFKKTDQGWLMSGTNAGLPEPAVAHNHTLRGIVDNGTYQGVVSGLDYPRFERQLTPGDGVVVATDGVVDLLDREGHAVWVPDGARFSAALEESASGALECIQDRIPRALPTDDRADDLTMIVVRIP